MTRKLRLLAALTAAGLFIIPKTATAKSEFVPLPAVEGKQKKSLKIRFLRYTGGSTGKMVIEVKNTGKHEEQFSARGLYFVPNGDPQRAPQRLGAAGPFDDAQGVRKEQLSLKPGQRATIKLQVFCLDSHRSSPGAAQAFSVARKRLPKSLRRTIEGGAKTILKQPMAKAADFAKANSAIQSHVWKTRNKRWIKLQGERKNEKSSPRYPRRNRIKRPLQQQINSF